jgi:hypothetical protein
MTDAPIADAAPVAASTAIPVEPTSVDTPNPIHSSLAADKAAERAAGEQAAKAAEAAREAAKPPEPKKPAKDAGEAVRNAMAKVKADAAEPKVDAKTAEIKAPEAKPDVSPADTKPATPAKYEPPARMSEDAKRDWATAPETVQREVDRMHREFEQGFQKYKQAAERDQQLGRFHQMAQQSGKPLAAVIDGYWQAEQAIRANPVQGLDAVCRNLGFSLRDIAAHVMGQPVEQQQQARDQEMHGLRQTIAQLQQRLGSVTQTIEQQRYSAVTEKINSFAKQHPRYAELETQMVQLLESRIATDLADAYAKAERLNPAPAKLQLNAASSAAPVDAMAQTLRESKSISGAPTPGSSPADKRRSSSIRESLKRATARAG